MADLGVMQKRCTLGLAFPVAMEVDGVPILFTRQLPATEENIAKVRKLLRLSRQRRSCG